MERERLRKFAADIKRYLLPVDISGNLSELSRFETVLDSGAGGIIVINHFSKGDFPQLALSLIFDRPGLRGRRFLAPIAYHQYHSAKGLASTFGVELAPLVTEDTKKYLEEHPEDQELPKTIASGPGFASYLRAAKEG